MTKAALKTMQLLWCR